jgi:negative regulator of sigma-B (phosphoserine phosphatase)
VEVNQMLTVSCNIAVRPYAPNGAICGDFGIITETADEIFLALVDVLGKGAGAAKIATIAGEYLRRNSSFELPLLMQGLHNFLIGTRGAVAALGRIHPASGRFSCVSVGNIFVQIWGGQKTHVIPQEGIVGYQMPTLREQTLLLHGGDVLVIHSDGVRGHVDFLQCQSILRKPNPAAEMISNFGKEDDDASCIVARCFNA